mgnify:CR=1 FL=1
MGIKIKKDTMPRLEDLPVLKIRYTMAIPLIGIVDILTMGSFYANPVTDGHIMLKIFYVINALIGGTFAYWGLRLEKPPCPPGLQCRKGAAVYGNQKSGAS